METVKDPSLADHVRVVVSALDADEMPDHLARELTKAVQRRNAKNIERAVDEFKSALTKAKTDIGTAWREAWDKSGDAVPVPAEPAQP